MPTFAHEAPEELGEAAPRARVLYPHRRAVVGADADQRVGHDRDDVVLVHPVLHDHRARVLRDERADRRERFERSVGRDVFDRSADRRRVGVRDDHGVAAVVGPHVPGVSCRRSDSGSAHRRLSSSTPPSDAADGSSVTRNVELAVYGYWSPRTSTPASRARWSVSSKSALFPLFSDRTPCSASLHPCPRTTADLDRLVQRLAEPLAFVSHVGRVRAPPPRRDPGERHDLVGLRVRRRNVDQPGREPDRPGVERLLGERAHRGERAVRELAARAVGGETKRPVADERPRCCSSVRPPRRDPDSRRSSRARPRRPGSRSPHASST